MPIQNKDLPSSVGLPLRKLRMELRPRWFLFNISGANMLPQVTYDPFFCQALNSLKVLSLKMRGQVAAPLYKPHDQEPWYCKLLDHTEALFSQTLLALRRSHHTFMLNTGGQGGMLEQD